MFDVTTGPASNARVPRFSLNAPPTVSYIPTAPSETRTAGTSEHFGVPPASVTENEYMR